MFHRNRNPILTLLLVSIISACYIHSIHSFSMPQSQQPSQPQYVRLDDGRKLAYAQYGDSSGTPVIHCHGSGGSRLEHPPDDAMLTEIGVRFISVDRPGHGYSDLRPGRTLLDFPNDISALTEHLRIDRFYVEGWSAGGPYALAIARQLPERVVACAILSGIGPHDRPTPYAGVAGIIKLWMFLARRNSSLVYPFRRMMHGTLSSKSSEDIGAMLAASGMAKDEMAVGESPALQQMMGLNIKEGYRQGWEGPAQDDFVVNQPWGFQPESIATKTYIWQGAVDKNVPLIQGEYQHKCLPNSQLTVLEDTAHMFPLVHWKDILVQLVEEE